MYIMYVRVIPTVHIILAWLWPTELCHSKTTAVQVQLSGDRESQRHRE